MSKNKNVLEIKFDDNNVFISLNYGMWSIKPITELTQLERILLRSISRQPNTKILCEYPPF